jgi:hypothetical protein
MLVTKTHIDWSARAALQSNERQRKKMHKRKANSSVEQAPVNPQEKLIPHGPQFLSPRVHILGGNMVRPINLDTYDS